MIRSFVEFTVNFLGQALNDKTAREARIKSTLIRSMT